MLSKSLLGKAKSRGLRNNNPGNLVLTSIEWQGKIPNEKNTDKHFEQFTTLVYGIRAMLKDVINDIKKGKNTVRKLINEYAPPHENDTKAYIEHVANGLGVSPDAKLTRIDGQFLLLLAKSIITKENQASEHKLVTDEDIKEAILTLGNVSTSQLEVVTTDVKTAVKWGLPAIALILFFLHVTKIINLKSSKWNR